MEAERLRILLSDVGCKGNADERVVLMRRSRGRGVCLLGVTATRVCEGFQRGSVGLKMATPTLPLPMLSISIS